MSNNDTLPTVGYNPQTGRMEPTDDDGQTYKRPFNDDDAWAIYVGNMTPREFMSLSEQTSFAGAVAEYAGERHSLLADLTNEQSEEIQAMLVAVIAEQLPDLCPTCNEPKVLAGQPCRCS